jgi:hypothetical protein
VLEHPVHLQSVPPIVRTLLAIIRCPPSFQPYLFSSEAAGLVKLATGLVFPVALFLIVAMGAELFTGNHVASFSTFVEFLQLLPSLIHFLVPHRQHNVLVLCPARAQVSVFRALPMIQSPRSTVHVSLFVRVLQSESLGPGAKLGVELHRQLLGVRRLCLLSCVPGGVDSSRPVAFLHRSSDW